MNQKKTWVFLKIFIFCACVVVALCTFVILPPFKTLEQSELTRNLDRCQATLQSESKNLSVLIKDWAEWDETYTFAQNGNEKYINDNLEWNYLNEGLGLNALYVISREGRIIWGKSSKIPSTPFPLDALDLILPQDAIFQKIIDGNTISGFFPSPEGYWLIAVNKITKTSGEDPINGIMVMGKLLSSDSFSRLSNQLQLDFSLRLPPKDEGIVAIKNDPVGSTWHPLNSVKAQAFRQIDDLSQSASTWIAITVPRELYQQGFNTTLFSGVVLVFIALGFSLLWSKNTDKTSKLHDSEATLASILRSAPIGIGQVTSRTFNYVNENYAQMLGYSVQELVGNNSRMTYPSDEEFERVGKYKYEEIKKKGTGSIETVLQKKDGTLIDVFMSSTPVNQSDLSQGVTFTALDITERKTTEEALRYQQNLLEKAQQLGQIGSWKYYPALSTFIGTEVANQIYGIPNGFKAKYEMLLKRVHPDDREYFQQDWKGALKSGVLDIEHRIVVNGTTKWVREKAEIEFNRDGEIVGGIGFTQDITERKQSDIALQESEQHLQLVFDNAPVALFQEDFSEVKAQIELLKQEGVNDFQTYFESNPEVVGKCATKVKIIDVNRAALKLHNANTTKELLEGLHKTFTEESYGAFCNELVALANGADSFYTEATVQTLDGEKREVLLQLFIDPNKENWSCVYVSLTDITDRRKAEQQRSELEIQLRQKYKMEAVGYMAGGMAHNFNNNLSIILGNVELSQIKLPQNNEVLPLLDNAKIAIRRSRDLVEKIITYSRKGIQNRVPIQLSSIIDETMTLVRSTLPSSVNLQRIISPESHSVVIDADASQIQEVLVNLCNNAVHAMDEKGVLKVLLETVELSENEIPAQYEQVAGRYAKLSVQDTGNGMPAEILDKIFDPFYTTKEDHEGAGMGLATVQGIVAQHGGIIKVNSVPDQELYLTSIFQL